MIRSSAHITDDAIERFRNKAILRLVNKLGVVQVNILSECHRDTFRGIPYKHLIRPLVIDDKESGKSLQTIANAWGVSIGVVRNILQG
jgi:hypothetical protein